MSEQELYKDEQRNIMIQECNALKRRVIAYSCYTNPSLFRGDVVLICLN